MSTGSHYTAPAKGSNFFNDTVARLAKVGISVYGSRLLCVKGRKTGQMRSTAVNPLTVDGQRYLIAPRGTTQWVRNLRAASGEGELRLGRKTERFTATEMDDEAKPDILRAYLKRYAFETGMFFDGVGAKSPEEELRRIAPRHPVFRITAR
ncbi:MAG: nitroreductase family deazaflavin-dependent oxidoreductase [Trebonia sp.]